MLFVVEVLTRMEKERVNYCIMQADILLEVIASLQIRIDDSSDLAPYVLVFVVY